MVIKYFVRKTIEISDAEEVSIDTVSNAEVSIIGIWKLIV
jgi:hypothetical protein